MDINIESQIVPKTAAQWAADNTVYSAKRILVTSDAYYGSTDQRKFKIADGVQTWAQLDYVPIAQTLAQVIANGDTLNGLLAQSVDTFSKVYVEDGDIDVYYNNGVKLARIVASALSLELTQTDLIKLSAPTINLPQGTASRIVETDASKNLTYAAKGTAYNKDFGTGTTNIVEIGSTLGNSLITSTDANGKLQTLTTATYPSLTELSYVKGVTSAIQDQLDRKPIQVKYCASLQNHSPADNTTLYFGSILNANPNTIATNRQFYLKTGTLKVADITFYSNTTLGSNEAVTINLRNITDSTSSAITTITMDVLASSKLVTGLSISTSSSKLYAIEIVFPAFATNPTNCQYSVGLEIY